jgi:hypothetical protein
MKTEKEKGFGAIFKGKDPQEVRVLIREALDQGVPLLDLEMAPQKILYEELEREASSQSLVLSQEEISSIDERMWPEGVPVALSRVFCMEDGNQVGWLRFQRGEGDLFHARDHLFLSKEGSKRKIPFIGCSKKTRLVTSQIRKILPEGGKLIDVWVSSAPILFSGDLGGVTIHLNAASDSLGKVYRFLKTASKEGIESLRKFNWEPSPTLWEAIKKNDPKSVAEIFHREVYLLTFSYNNRGEVFAENRKKWSWGGLSAFREAQELLKGVEISSGNPIEIILNAGEEDILLYYPLLPCPFEKEVLKAIGESKARKVIVRPEGSKDLIPIRVSFFKKEGPPIEDVVIWTNLPIEKQGKLVSETIGGENLEELSNQALIELHGKIHAEWEGRGSRIDDELCINAHILVVTEIMKRNLDHRPKEVIDVLTLEAMKISLQDILPYLDRSFVLKDPYLAVTGSLAVEGRGNDIDIWVNEEEDSPFLSLLDFRLRSILPEPLKKRFHIIPSRSPPFTNYIPLARLKIEVLPHDRQEMITMGYGRTILGTSVLSPGHFVIPLKVGEGYRKNELYSIEGLLEVVDFEKGDWVAEEKFDGMRIQIHRSSDDKTQIFSIQGKDVSHRFPTALAILSAENLPSFILDGECTGKNMGRGDVSGYSNSTKRPDDKPFTMNLFDCLYVDGNDLHEKSLRERKSALAMVGDLLKDTPQEIIHIVEFRIAKTPEELKKNVDYFSKILRSEGSMVKLYESQYPLTGSTSDWIKYKNEVDIDVKVIGKVKNKGETFNYQCVIHDERDKAVPIGTTYNTKIDVPVGGIIRVAMVNLNKYRDPSSGTLWYNWVFPRFLEYREDKTVPDTVSLADEINQTTKGEIDEKPYPTEFKELLHIERMEKISHPRNWAVIQAHFRGKTVHFDFRQKVNGFLEGFSLLSEPEGLVLDPVISVQRGEEEISKHWEEWKFRPGMDPNKKCLAIPKENQPLEWLDVAPGVHGPGEVGATKEYPGVFVLIDQGMAYPGVRKPYFREFFLDMKKFKGRMILRVIGFDESPEGKKLSTTRLQWNAWMAKQDDESQIPYILTRRARMAKDYLPDEGESALPPWWENQIPPSLRWWIKGLTPKERYLRLDLAYNDLIERKKIKGHSIEIQKKTGKFALRLLWWKGQTVVRDIPNRRWEVLIDTGEAAPLRWILQGDPSSDSPVSAEKSTLNRKTPDGKSPHEWLGWQGSLPPSDPENPTKKLAVNVEILDKGIIQIYENSDIFLSAEFKGEILKGYFIFKREDPVSDIWVFSRSELPIEKDATFTFLHKESPQRFVLGPVLLPEETDSQKHIISIDAIEEAAHQFLLRKGRIGLQHKDFTRNLEIAESYVLREDLTMGGQHLPKGTWMLGVILEPEIWELVEKGELTGFSVGGWGITQRTTER